MIDVKNKSILLVGNFLSKKVGTQGINESLAYHFSQLDWNVTVTSMYENRILRLTDMLQTIWFKRNSYLLAQVDVFSGPAFRWAEASTLLLKFLNRPYILTLRGGNLPHFAQNNLKRVHNLLSSATAITTPSRYLQQELSDIRNDILHLPNGVDIRKYDFVHRTTAKPSLGWLRAFHNIYNPNLIPNTFALLTSEFPDIHITMFGPDKGDGSLQSMRAIAEKAGIADRFTVAGPIPKETVPERLAPYDIFLNTTTAESFGVSVVEAAALGMCIVTTNVGELPYIWTHDHDALLVPPNNPEAMANAIRRILTEPGLAEKLSRNARAKAETFDWSIVLPQWEALLTEVIEKHG